MDSEGDNTSAKLITQTGSLSGLSDGDFDDDEDAYTDYAGAKFCVVKITSGTGTNIDPYVYTIPYNEDQLECTTTPGAGPTGAPTGANAWAVPSADL